MVAHGNVEFQWSEPHFKEGNIDVLVVLTLQI